MEEEYQPVPVGAAREVSKKYAKEVVVILAVDVEHDKVHTTTYGVEPRHKEFAAILGEIVARAIGCDLKKSEMFEDYRHRDQAQWAKEREELSAEIASLKQLCRTCAFCDTEFPTLALLKAHCGACEPHPLAQENRRLKAELKEVVGAAMLVCELFDRDSDADGYDWSSELADAVEDLADVVYELGEYMEAEGNE